jgi:magnesium transporter
MGIIRHMFRRQARKSLAPAAVDKPLASAPGTLVHVGEKRIGKTRVARIDYDPSGYGEMDTGAPLAEKIAAPSDPSKITWIDVVGLHDVETISEIGENFDVPALVLEDILNTAGRPKIEDFDDFVFVVTRMITQGKAGKNGADAVGEIDSQYFAVLLLPNKVVITFREATSGIFQPVRKRIRVGKGRIRKAGADYLVWAIVDAVIDNYLDVINVADDLLSSYEDRLDSDDTSVEIGHLHSARREVVQLYREMRPVREITNTLYRTESKLVVADSAPYFRDLHDHSVQAEETISDLRDASNSLRDYYHTVVSNRMNEVMKVLTALSTIFLPLTFLAGIYGMNFEHMPELAKTYAYPVFWGVSLIIAVSLFTFFKRKNWL